MNADYLQIIGLIFDITGAIFLAYGLIISKREAMNLGLSKFGGETDEQNLKLPQVQDRIKQSRNAIFGLIFLVLGFSFQIGSVLM